MKRLYILLIVWVVMLAAGITPLAAIQAQTEPPSLSGNLEALGDAARYDTSKDNITYFSVIVGTIISYFLALLGLIFLGLIIYGGVIWLLAHGNEENVNKAKSIIRNAIIGVILVVGSYAIVYFVLVALGSGGFNTNLSGFQQ